MEVATRERALDDAIGGYLAFLRVERGLAPATLSAYATDLRDFAASTRGGRWADSPEVATTYLAARTRRGGADAGLAPTSLRRRAAAIRGFYRFAYGEGPIRVDLAARPDLARQ